jgi:serine/threonine protein kinase
MPLPPDTRLGAYEVMTLLGAGGMGQVYRARDTRLDRDVAIKILPEAFAQDADRLALAGTLYGVRPGDPLTFLIIAGVLAVVSLAACSVLAVRAMRVEPLVALKAN